MRPDPGSFNRVARALDAEATGREWRADLAVSMEQALQPGVAAVRSALMARGGGGLGHGGQPLRQAVAAAVHTGPLSSGAQILAGTNGMPRSFRNAPKRLNQRSFRRRVYGSNTWVVQVGAPGWFDDTLSQLRPKLRAAALQVLQRRARRISRKA